MGLRMKNFNTLIFCGFTDKSNFSGGGGSRKPNNEEGWPKKGAWAVSRFKGGGLGKKDGVGCPNANYESEIVFKLSPIVLLRLMLFFSGSSLIHIYVKNF